jgi:hypothetical protein
VSVPLNLLIELLYTNFACRRPKWSQLNPFADEVPWDWSWEEDLGGVVGGVGLADTLRIDTQRTRSETAILGDEEEGGSGSSFNVKAYKIPKTGSSAGTGAGASAAPRFSPRAGLATATSAAGLPRRFSSNYLLALEEEEKLDFVSLVTKHTIKPFAIQPVVSVSTCAAPTALPAATASTEETAGNKRQVYYSSKRSPLRSSKRNDSSSQKSEDRATITYSDSNARALPAPSAPSSSLAAKSSDKIHIITTSNASASTFSHLQFLWDTVEYKTTPEEELREIVKACCAFLEIYAAPEGRVLSDCKMGELSSSTCATLELLRRDFHINPDGSTVPLSIPRSLMHGTARQFILKKLAKVREKSDKLLQLLEQTLLNLGVNCVDKSTRVQEVELDVSSQVTMDRMLIQEFLLEQFSSLSKPFLRAVSIEC